MGKILILETLMDFQIHALAYEPFSVLFDLSDTQLAARSAVREVVLSCPGSPCRVSLADAQVGETVVLLNYQHQPAPTPFQSAHAIYVRQGAVQAELCSNEVPSVLLSRLVSLRCFGADGMMMNADLMEGSALQDALWRAFDNDLVVDVHLHYAKPGCFAARATRAI